MLPPVKVNLPVKVNSKVTFATDASKKRTKNREIPGYPCPVIKEGIKETATSLTEAPMMSGVDDGLG